MAFIDVPGYKDKLRIEDITIENLDRVRHSVIRGGWDYVAIVSGLPGVGKSTFAHQICKYLDPTFDVDRICFTAKDFKEKTSTGVKGQAFMLDESFADMNSSLSKDPEFVSIINHLQLIRQKHLFLILVLPDFFSLQKTVAIFRSSHLFVVYSDSYERGSYAVFDRGAKRELYIRGKQFINYQAWKPNYRSNYSDGWFIDYDTYEARKNQHLQEQAQVKEKGAKASFQRNMLTYLINYGKLMNYKELSDWIKCPYSTVADWGELGEKRIKALNLHFPPLKFDKSIGVKGRPNHDKDTKEEVKPPEDTLVPKD